MAALPSPSAHPRAPLGAPAPERRPDLRVVGRRRHRGRYLVMLSTLVALGVFGIVSLHALAAEAAFEARTLEAEVSELSMRYEELTASVATLESPARIREIATTELDMVPASEPGHVVLEDVEVPRAVTGHPAVADPLKRLLAHRD